MPTKEAPKDFLMNGVKIGKFWPPLAVIINTIIDMLEVYYGQYPEILPSQLWLIDTHRDICS